jgi:hypothetical protein
VIDWIWNIAPAVAFVVAVFFVNALYLLRRRCKEAEEDRDNWEAECRKWIGLCDKVQASRNFWRAQYNQKLGQDGNQEEAKHGE